MSKFISDYRLNMLNATLSQKSLLVKYDLELEKNIKALKTAREQIMASESDAVYQNELALLKTNGCQPQTKDGRFVVVCESRPTVLELETQARELKAVKELLQTQRQRMRLDGKFNEVIRAYEAAEWENQQRIRETQRATIAGLATIAADLKTRYQIELQRFDTQG